MATTTATSSPMKGSIYPVLASSSSTHSRTTSFAAPTSADSSSSSPTACSSSPINPHLTVTSSSCASADLFVQVLASNVWRHKRLIQRAMLLTVRMAKQRILITNPYFFPPPKLYKALQSAAARGVEVKVIMAGEGRTDVPFVRWASQHVYATLLRQGVEIYELQNATLHAKTVSIDGIYTTIGSFNWDRWSAQRNLEVNLTILDPCIARSMEEHFSADLANCSRVTLESLDARSIFHRALHRVFYWIMRWL